MKPEIMSQEASIYELLPVFRELLAEGQKIRLTVTGTSMLPLLRNRIDSVLLAKAARYKKYDIVLYTRPDGKPILHRIIKETKDGFMIVGDNRREVDGPIAPECVLALAEGVYRGDSYIPCSTWWYKLYSRVWMGAGNFRAKLFPVVVFFGRLIKRIKQVDVKHEVDSK